MKLTKEKFIEIRMLCVEGEINETTKAYFDKLWDRLVAGMDKKEFAVFSSFVQSATYRKMLEQRIHEKYVDIENDVYQEMILEAIEQTTGDPDFMGEFDDGYVADGDLTGTEVTPEIKVIH